MMLGSLNCRGGEVSIDVFSKDRLLLHCGGILVGHVSYTGQIHILSEFNILLYTVLYFENLISILPCIPKYYLPSSVPRILQYNCITFSFLIPIDHENSSKTCSASDKSCM